MSFYSEKRVKEDIYLIPFAMAELGFIKMKQNNAIEAKELLEPARYSLILICSLIYFIHIYIMFKCFLIFFNVVIYLWYNFNYFDKLCIPDLELNLQFPSEETIIIIRDLVDLFTYVKSEINYAT